MRQLAMSESFGLKKLKPDFKPIADFRKENKKVLKNVIY